MLDTLIQMCPNVVQPYFVVIMNTLQKLLACPNVTISTNALSAVGALARVAGGGLTPYVPFCVGVVLDTITDQVSVSKRETAVRVLGDLAQHTGFVAQAYNGSCLLREK